MIYSLFPVLVRNLLSVTTGVLFFAKFPSKCSNLTRSTENRRKPSNFDFVLVIADSIWMFVDIHSVSLKDDSFLLVCHIEVQESVEAENPGTPFGVP